MPKVSRPNTRSVGPGSIAWCSGGGRRGRLRRGNKPSFGADVSDQEEARLAALITARPDATLAELRDALPTTAALRTLWRTIGRLGFTVKKNVHADEQRRPDVAAARRQWRDWQPLRDVRQYIFDECGVTTDCCGGMAAVRAARASTTTRPAASGRRTRWSRRCAWRGSRPPGCSTARSIPTRSAPMSTRSSSRRCGPATSSCSTISPSTSSRPFVPRSKPLAPRSASCRPTVQISIPSNRPSPN